MSQGQARPLRSGYFRRRAEGDYLADGLGLRLSWRLECAGRTGVEHDDWGYAKVVGFGRVGPICSLKVVSVLCNVLSFLRDS
jgi:hypothetical protein